MSQYNPTFGVSELMLLPIDGLSVVLVVDHMQPSQPANQFAVTLLNQKSNNQHRSVSTHLQCRNPIGVSLMPSFVHLISLDDLHQITPTCQFLKDDTLFFEVFAKS